MSAELLKAAANYLENYAEFLRTECPVDLNRHPYVPEMEQAVEELRALSTQTESPSQPLVEVQEPARGPFFQVLALDKDLVEHVLEVRGAHQNGDATIIGVFMPAAAPVRGLPLTEDEAVVCVAQVLPVVSSEPREFWQVRHKDAVAIVRDIEAAHGISSSAPGGEEPK
jgi:hypothetical protein